MLERKANVTVETHPSNANVKVLTIEGILDTVTSEEVDKDIMPLVEEDDGYIIADLGKLEYMNSTGMANLMRYYIQKKRRGGSFKIINASDFIYEIMDISGAIKLLEIYKTMDEALATCK